MTTSIALITYIKTSYQSLVSIQQLRVSFKRIFVLVDITLSLSLTPPFYLHL